MVAWVKRVSGKRKNIPPERETRPRRLEEPRQPETGARESTCLPWDNRGDHDERRAPSRGIYGRNDREKDTVPPPVLEVFPLPLVRRRAESDKGRDGQGEGERGNAITTAKSGVRGCKEN